VAVERFAAIQREWSALQRSRYVGSFWMSLLTSAWLNPIARSIAISRSSSTFDVRYQNFAVAM
jgi:hypothetical protein